MLCAWSRLCKTSRRRICVIGSIPCRAMCLFAATTPLPDIVIGLCADMGLRAFHAGGIENSAAAEALTSVLIAINRLYKVPGGAGIRITRVAD